MARDDSDDRAQEPVPEANAPTGMAPEDLIPDNPDEDPVSKAYARTGRADTTGISGIPASDEDAGRERRKLYEEGADFVSRID